MVRAHRTTGNSSWHGKPRPEQDQIGEIAGKPAPSVPSGLPGRLLEVIGDNHPR